MEQSQEAPCGARNSAEALQQVDLEIATMHIVSSQQTVTRGHMVKLSATVKFLKCGTFKSGNLMNPKVVLKQTYSATGYEKG
jgi:hypothetical protein